MSDEPHGRLARWSKRKAEARGGGAAAGLAADAPLDGVQRSAEETGQVGAVSGPAPQIRGRMITDPIIAAPPVQFADDGEAGTNIALTSADEDFAGGVTSDDAAVEDETGADGGTNSNRETDFSDVDFDALDANSDYTRFMGKGVPEAIREKALAKLWTSNPVFNVMDGLDDYAEDFTDAVWAVGDIRTDYKVGRGFLDDDDVAQWDELGADAKKRAQQDMDKRQSEALQASESGGETGGAGSGLCVQIETPDQREILAFFEASERYHSALYPVDSNHFAPLSTLMTPQVRFVVARVGGEIAGCGALVLNDEAGPENSGEKRGEKRGEIKRMWVDPAGRGKGVGSAIVAQLERLAAAEGVTLLGLETGNKQPEAFKLYRAHGFQECEAFGSYRADPLSIFMEKKMPPAKD